MVTNTPYLTEWASGDYPFDRFVADVNKMCEVVWLDGCRDIETIKLPSGLFPHLTEFLNPITRSVIKVERVDLIDLCTFVKPVWMMTDD